MHRPGPYQIQAAIAALHAQALTYAETDWPQIRVLYDRLDELSPSPVVKLNRAVATRYVAGAEQLADYRLFHAVRGELLSRELLARRAGQSRM